jgi:hypothetical protein
MQYADKQRKVNQSPWMYKIANSWQLQPLQIPMLDPALVIRVYSALSCIIGTSTQDQLQWMDKPLFDDGKRPRDMFKDNFSLKELAQTLEAWTIE